MALRFTPFTSLFVFGVILAGCSAQALAADPVYLSQRISPDSCQLLENGGGVDPKVMQFAGTHSEGKPQVYDCAVQIPMAEFKRKLGVCVAGGHNITPGYFSQGKPEHREHSCDVRPLANGNMYFHASGSDADSCKWICFPSGKLGK